MNLHTEMFEDGTAYKTIGNLNRFIADSEPYAWHCWDKVKLVCLDVDGVLTDGAMYWTPEGRIFKKFHTRDVTAVKRLQQAGIKVAAITSADCPITRSRLLDMKVDYTWEICEDKWRAIQEIAGELCEMDTETVAFAGDDDMDREALSKVGSAFVPKDGLNGLPGYRCVTKGGEGVLSEIAELILKARNG